MSMAADMGFVSRGSAFEVGTNMYVAESKHLESKQYVYVVEAHGSIAQNKMVAPINELAFTRWFHHRETSSNIKKHWKQLILCCPSLQ